jgi:P27 family predicted phage terminase small subunit
MPRDRKDLAEHELQGTKPQYVIDSSDVAAGRPKYPKNISPEAKSAFKSLVKMLEARRTVTSGDQEILRLYAILFDRHSRAVEHVAAEGEIVECEAVSKKGDVYTVSKPNQWLKIAEVCETKMAQILVQLGLTPRTRTQVKATKAPAKPEAQFPAREEAAPTQPLSDADMLASIDETKESVN